MENRLVSVIIAVYDGNNPLHLKKAVESILSQTYSPIECIIVIDGRVSEELDACLNEIGSDERVRIISFPKNGGPAKARNEGFLRSKGKYIAIMDADDISAPDRIHKQVQFLEHTGADLVGSFMYYINEEDKIIDQKRMPLTMEEMKKYLFLINPINNPTVFARAEILKENLYNINYRRAQDYELWIRLIKKGCLLMNQPEYLLYFRLGEKFFSKRRALFYPDLKLKLKVLTMYTPFKIPFYFVLAMMSVLLRLLPPAGLKMIYKIRNRLTFSGKKLETAQGQTGKFFLTGRTGFIGTERFERFQRKYREHGQEKPHEEPYRRH